MMTVAPELSGECDRPGQILIVEDEVLIRMHLAEELRGAGFQVVEACNAAEARRVLQSIADIKLMITDVRMPGEMDGVALAGWARRFAPAIRVIIVSANVTAVLPPEADAAFGKPLVIDEIISAVRHLLHHSEQQVLSAR